MKSNIDIINSNVRKTVEKSIDKKMEIMADKVADRAVEKLRSNNLLRDELSYYRKVELSIMSLNGLREAVKQKEEEIEELDKYGLPQKSKSVVINSRSVGNPETDRYLEKKAKCLMEKEETERGIKKIEKALNKIKDDKYFEIIELRYLLNDDERIYSDEAIAEKLNKDRSTISRNRKRLINKLVTIMFPQTIQELI